MQYYQFRFPFLFNLIQLSRLRVKLSSFWEQFRVVTVRCWWLHESIGQLLLIYVYDVCFPSIGVTFKSDFTFFCRVNGVVHTGSGVHTVVPTETSLAGQNIVGEHLLATEFLYSQLRHFYLAFFLRNLLFCLLSQLAIWWQNCFCYSLLQTLHHTIICSFLD